MLAMKISLLLLLRRRAKKQSAGSSVKTREVF